MRNTEPAISQDAADGLSQFSHIEVVFRFHHETRVRRAASDGTSVAVAIPLPPKPPRNGPASEDRYRPADRRAVPGL
jgi:hypothetical protein